MMIVVDDKIIMYDKEEDLWTIAYNGKGGPIICDHDYDEALRKYERAFSVATAVQKLMTFARTGSF